MFGLFNAVPETVATAWGARLIYPDDMLHDRQGWKGYDASATDTQALTHWLNSGAIRKALTKARKLADARKITREGAQRVELHRDAKGVIVACPNSSHGYLYVAGWLHQGEEARQPAPEFAQ